MPQKTITLLISAAEAGNLQRFTLASGQTITGWIVEINDSTVMVYSENPKEKGQEKSFLISEVLADTIAYFQAVSQTWVLAEHPTPIN